ncbi:MAG: LytTR family DNA-binding domain-containing protein [Lachnospiraceae bacterium]|nr:LytTR family DNA-binding domain-containing protein [Lachnospiraceae bacterium]
MKIHIELNENLTEDELIIRCRSISSKILEIQKTASDIINSSQKLIFYKGNTEYYLAVDDILFFETEGGQINAHTRSGIYQTKYKLYELENILPGFFMRISKSAILNTKQIYSINRNLTASSIVEFTGTHKRVFVSRYYYKPLISKLEEQRLH